MKEKTVNAENSALIKMDKKEKRPEFCLFCSSSLTSLHNTLFNENIELIDHVHFIRYIILYLRYFNVLIQKDEIINDKKSPVKIIHLTFNSICLCNIPIKDIYDEMFKKLSLEDDLSEISNIKPYIN